MKIIERKKEEKTLKFDDLKHGDVFYYVDEEESLYLKGKDSNGDDCDIELSSGEVNSPDYTVVVIPVEGVFVKEV